MHHNSTVAPSQNQQLNSLEEARRDYDRAWQQLAFAFSTPVAAIIADIHANAPHPQQSPSDSARERVGVQS
mgnify:CR=1 FL=1